MINYQLSLKLAALQTETVMDSWKQKCQKCFQAHLERGGDEGSYVDLCVCVSWWCERSIKSSSTQYLQYSPKAVFFPSLLLLTAVCRARRYKRPCDERLRLLNIDKVGWKTMSERAERWLMESERAGERLLSFPVIIITFLQRKSWSARRGN